MFHVSFPLLLQLIKNVHKQDAVLYRIPAFEKAVSRVLRDIKVVRRYVFSVIKDPRNTRITTTSKKYDKLGNVISSPVLPFGCICWYFTYVSTLTKHAPFQEYLAHFSLFEKINVYLCEHISLCVCMCILPLSTLNA
jgi:hypothetical protein